MTATLFPSSSGQSASSSEPKYDTLTGTVHRVVWPKSAAEYETTTFRIFLLDAPLGRFSVKGDAPGISAGARVSCDGIWESHNQFGKTLKLVSIREDLPSDLFEIQTYLAKAKIPGLGPKTAERIVDTFKSQVFDILDHDSQRLLEVKGLKKKTADRIIKGWNEKRASHAIMLFLQKHGIAPGMAHKVYKYMGGEGISPDAIIKRIKENPYQISDIRGIGFKSADTMAEKLGIPRDSQFRILAGIDHVLSEEASNGHTIREWDIVHEKTRSLLEIQSDIVTNGMGLSLAPHIQLFTTDNIRYLAKTRLYQAERDITRELARLQTFAIPIAGAQNPILAGPFSIQSGAITLVGKQEDAVRMAASKGISIITGRPGTGKTSILRAVIDIADRLGRRIACCAPTGLAAIRLSEAVGMEATTIHRLLGMKFKENSEEEKPINIDFLVVDETSMIGTGLMAELLRRLPNGCVVVFVGDIDQLPSVDPGNILSDFINSGKIPTVRLDHIYRQQIQGGGGLGIIDGAHAIIEGRMPSFNNTDFCFIEKEDDTEAAKLIVKVVERIHQLGTPYSKIQVLSPMKNGEVGVNNLNLLLQEALNPPSPSKKEIVFRGKTFREGDRGLYLVNDYELGIVNGDVFYIDSIDIHNNTMDLSFSGNRNIQIDKSLFENISHHWASSIHKAQGGEHTAIVLAVSMSHYVMLNQNLYYTGVTRARSKCVLVGNKKALRVAVATKSNSKRSTGLKTLLVESLSIAA